MEGRGGRVARGVRPEAALGEEVSEESRTGPGQGAYGQGPSGGLGKPRWLGLRWWPPRAVNRCGLGPGWGRPTLGELERRHRENWPGECRRIRAPRKSSGEWKREREDLGGRRVQKGSAVLWEEVMREKLGRD